MKTEQPGERRGEEWTRGHYKRVEMKRKGDASEKQKVERKKKKGGKVKWRIEEIRKKVASP